MSEFYKGRILLQFETDREEDPVGKVQGRFGSFVSLINFWLMQYHKSCCKIKEESVTKRMPLSFLNGSRVIYEIRRELNLTSTSLFSY